VRFLDSNTQSKLSLTAVNELLLVKSDFTLDEFFDYIQEFPDDVDLLPIIILLSENFYIFWTDNSYAHETFEGIICFLKQNNILSKLALSKEYWTGWIDIITTLASDGSQEVILGRLKPYISLLI
jgi:hypothetical protein